MNSTDSPALSGDRRIDLDWVRIIAFGLLIFYHVASFYWPGTPHNQALSPRGLPWLIVPMLAVNPWRLLILFIVSGAATRFMADKMKPGALLRLRNARLGPPLLLAIAVLGPPMGFVAALQWGGFHGDLVSYLRRYVSSIGPDGVNWEHLWFVGYLLVYTTALVGVLAAAPNALPALQRGLERALSGWGLIAWPVACLALARFALGGFPQTGNVYWDWYSHAIYLPGFLFGFSMVKSEALWARFEAWRGRLLAAALIVYAALIASAIVSLGADFNWGPKVAAHVATTVPAALLAYASIIYGLDQWLWIGASFGFARRYLSRADGPARRYLTEAIFPFYIIHEVTIVVGGYYLARLDLPLGLEAFVLIAATVLSCFATYEIARRVGWLRPLFGLKRLPSSGRTPVISAATSEA